MKSLQEVIKEQTAASRRKIARRVKKLVAKEMASHELRKARKDT